MLVPAVVATTLLVALAVAAAVVTSRPVPPPGVPVPIVAGSAARPVPPAGGSAPRRVGPERALAVLREWDARREAAWAAGDTTALAELYTAGSAAGAADLRMLRAWRARGLRVTGLRPRVLALEVVHRGPGRLVLGITERWGRAVAVGPGVRRVLPAEPATSRRVELRRGGGGGGGGGHLAGWRVVEVRRSA